MANLNVRTRLGRQVFEIYLLAACALVGLSGIVAPATRARSLVVTFPPVAQLGWYVGILLGGLVAILGIVRGCAIGMLIERAALIVLAGMCASFGIASVAFAGPVAITGSIMLWGFVAPCVARAVQITSDLRVVREALRSMAGEK